MLNVLDNRRYDPVGHCIYCGVKNKYLFSWDDIPGNDNGRLIEFLKQKFGIDWVKTAEIEKIDNGNTIKASTEINHLSLNLNQKKNKVIFKIDDVRTDKFIAKMENGKLNIYKKNLSDEHILPFGLSGTAILPHSSCSKCAMVTSEQERRVQRGFMQDVRVYLGTKSRRKHKNAPSEYPLIIMRGGMQETVMLPLDEYPILLHFPIFSPPAFLNPSGYTNGIRIRGIATVSFGPKPTEVLSNLDASSISQTKDQKPVSFARVIAKIAYAFAAAQGALDKIIGDSLVLPAILGNTDDIGRWVGTLTYPIRVFDGQLHRILIHEDHQKGLLIGEVQLFSNSHTPRYGVIIGILR